MQNKMMYLIFAVLVVIAVALCTLAYFMWQAQPKTETKQEPKITTTASTEVLLNPNGATSVAGPTVNPATAAVIPTTEAVKPKPVVVFEAEGSFAAGDKQKLQERIVDPYIDYYLDTYEPGYIVSITISKNDKSTAASYPYLGSAVFKNGGNNGFAISRDLDTFAWWAPDCMKCEFTPAFKAKYPEIVEKYEN